MMLTNQRSVKEEIMDRPDVEADAHAEALAGLRRINVASKVSAQMAAPIIEMARRRKLARISMLDVACGGGDVPVGVVLAAKQAGIEIELNLLDRSDTALKLAEAAAKNAGIDCRCMQADLLGDWKETGWKEGSFDVVTCSLFLHHILESTQVVELLSRMKTISRRQVVISDLRRCRMGLAAAWIGSRILSRSYIVHYDAPTSVRAAWTMRELTEFSGKAGMKDVRIQRSFPWRMLLTWEGQGA
jgi:2-polyprenyl-3-methyl-5-hydroxy-6-metoxy-1,4-benzoquinol methylase